MSDFSSNLRRLRKRRPKSSRKNIIRNNRLKKPMKLKPLLRRHRPGICRNGGMISVSGCIRTSSLIRIHLSLRRDSARGKTGRSNICMTITTKAAGILPPGILKTHRAKTSPSRYMPAGAPSKNMASNRRKRLRKQSFLHSPIE